MASAVGRMGILLLVSVLDLFIFIHFSPSIPITILFEESFFTSEYARPVKQENIKISLT